MLRRLTAVVLVLLGSCAGACGGAGTRTGSVAETAAGSGTRAAPAAATSSPAVSHAAGVHGRLLGDGDRDNRGDIDGDEYEDGDPDSDASLAGVHYHDRDDRAIAQLGHAPAAGQRRAIVALVERYYAALASGAGETACALMSPAFARSLPEAYGSAGPSYLRGGRTCSAIVALASTHLRRQLAGQLQVTGVRVKGAQAYALVGSTTMAAGYLQLQRVGAGWRIVTLTDLSLP